MAKKIDKSLQIESRAVWTRTLISSRSAESLGRAFRRSMTRSYAGLHQPGVQIERELYFKLPKNLPGMNIPGLEEGSLLKSNKSIYGTNDAARAWYKRIVQIVLGIGFEQLQFETVAFKLMHHGQLVGLLCLHVDDVLMAFDIKEPVVLRVYHQASEGAGRVW
eukprot:960957-Pyramimonas_sp.AAC.1